MKRTVLIALFTALLCTDAHADEVGVAQPEARAHDTRNATTTRIATGESLNEQMTRLAVRPATTDLAELTRDEKLALLLFVSAARQNVPRH